MKTGALAGGLLYISREFPHFLNRRICRPPPAPPPPRGRGNWPTLVRWCHLGTPQRGRLNALQYIPYFLSSYKYLVQTGMVAGDNIRSINKLKVQELHVKFSESVNFIISLFTIIIFMVMRSMKLML